MVEGPLKGAVSAQKNSSRVCEIETNEMLEGTKEDNIFPDEETLPYRPGKSMISYQKANRKH